MSLRNFSAVATFVDMGFLTDTGAAVNRRHSLEKNTGALVKKNTFENDTGAAANKRDTLRMIQEPL